MTVRSMMKATAAIMPAVDAVQQNGKTDLASILQICISFKNCKNLALKLITICYLIFYRNHGKSLRRVNVASE
jgi:hypothetical protein